MDMQWAKHPISRRMRAHGFGVHSPFAFDFIRRVLAQPCAYYCYDDIKRLAATNREAATARLLFRIMLHFRPETIALPDGMELTPAMLKAIGAASPRTATSHDASFILVRSTPEGPIAPGTIIFTPRPYVDPAAHAAPQFGMSFAGTSGSVYVGLPHLPRQTFELTD